MAELREQQQYDADRRLAAELQDDQQQHIPYEQQPIYGQPPWPDDSGRGCCSSGLPPRVMAPILHGELVWRSSTEAVLCVLLLVFLTSASTLLLALGLAAILAPALGLAAARWRSWRLALPHAVATAGAVCVRAIIIPMGSDNLLTGATSAACALPTLHALLLALRWMALLWCVRALFFTGGLLLASQDSACVLTGNTAICSCGEKSEGRSR